MLLWGSRGCTRTQKKSPSGRPVPNYRMVVLDHQGISPHSMQRFRVEFVACHPQPRKRSHSAMLIQPDFQRGITNSSINLRLRRCPYRHGDQGCLAALTDPHVETYLIQMIGAAPYTSDRRRQIGKVQVDHLIRPY